jgi:hypothetical protein
MRRSMIHCVSVIAMKKCSFYISTPEVAQCSKKLRPLHNKHLTSFTVFMEHTSEKERKGMVRMYKRKAGI